MRAFRSQENVLVVLTERQRLRVRNKLIISHDADMHEDGSKKQDSACQIKQKLNVLKVGGKSHCKGSPMGKCV